jgi:hypothetical protein
MSASSTGTRTRKDCLSRLAVEGGRSGDPEAAGSSTEEHQEGRGPAKAKKSLAHLPATTKTALGKQGAAGAARTRSGASSPKTRAELYEEAKRRDLPGRSKMGRAELARRLGHG